MRIRLAVTVKVDPAKWAELNGLDGLKVAEDVRDYVAYTLDQSASMSEAGADVSARLT